MLPAFPLSDATCTVRKFLNVNMKISSTWTFVGIAVVAGALAFFFSKRYLDQQESRIRAELSGTDEGTVSIVVASRNLFPGDTISAQTMAMGSIPSAHLSLRMIKPNQFEAVQGHVLGRPLRAGEPLMADYISGSSVERLSELIAPGERAVSLEVTQLANHDGMLLPGDFVDLFVVKDADTQGGSKSAGAEKLKQLLPVLEKVKVLAAGQAALRSADQDYSMLDDRQSQYTELTVAVPVEDAERLVLARELGDMAYLLRRPNDPGINVAVTMDSSMVATPASMAGDSGKYRYVSGSALDGRVESVVSTKSTAATVAVSQPIVPDASIVGTNAGGPASANVIRSPAAELVDKLYHQAQAPTPAPDNSSAGTSASARTAP